MKSSILSWLTSIRTKKTFIMMKIDNLRMTKKKMKRDRPLVKDKAITIAKEIMKEEIMGLHIKILTRL